MVASPSIVRSRRSARRELPATALAFCLLFSFFGGSDLAEAQEDLKSLARRSSGSVVLLEVTAGGRGQGTGTGFFIDDETLVTNHHVIRGARRVQVSFDDGRKVPITEVLAEDAGLDLAVLRLPNASAPSLPLYRGDRVEPGEEVVVLGNPEGLSGTLSTGIVSAWRENTEALGLGPRPVLQITAPISPGSSGSPVMNRRGEVLGVAVAVHRSGQNLNFAVPVDELRGLLDQITDGPSRTIGGLTLSTGSPWLRNGLISLLVLTALILALRRLK